jgi:hypothetical protein
MLTLFACCKKAHSKRLLTIENENELIKTKKHIMIVDITNALKITRHTSHTSNIDPISNLHAEAITHPKANETHFKMGLNHQDAYVREISKRRLDWIKNSTQ